MTLTGLDYALASGSTVLHADGEASDGRTDTNMLPKTSRTIQGNW